GHLGIEQLKIAPQSPWQNGYAERFIGTLRRELLDHLIIVNERQLLRAVRAYVAYYNEDRPHLALAGDAPISGPVEPPAAGKVVALPRVGGLQKARGGCPRAFDLSAGAPSTPRGRGWARSAWALRGPKVNGEGE